MLCEAQSHAPEKQPHALVNQSHTLNKQVRAPDVPARAPINSTINISLPIEVCDMRSY